MYLSTDLAIRFLLGETHFVQLYLPAHAVDCKKRECILLPSVLA